MHVDYVEIFNRAGRPFHVSVRLEKTRNPSFQVTLRNISANTYATARVCRPGDGDAQFQFELLNAVRQIAAFIEGREFICGLNAESRLGRIIKFLINEETITT